jgi:endonuclease YncB( thermonuclease family)
MRRIIFTGLIISGLFLGHQTMAREPSSQSLTVFDGDTFSQNGQVIRIWGIDAPELKQKCTINGISYACGEVSKAYLKSLLSENDVECISMPKSSFETRTVSKCYIQTHDLGQMMVSSGWATDYTYFSKGEYEKQENLAKAEHRGIWSGQFESPYEWRKRHKK